MSTERSRKEITAIIAEIEAIPRESRDQFRQEEDSEAYEIVRRIERKLLGLPVATPETEEANV